MTQKHVLILCNALDDVTRLERAITTDSPAASRKVFMLAQALRGAGVRTTVVSFGRGYRSGGSECFPTVVRRPRRVPTVYVRFVNRPVWSEIVSLVAAAVAVARLHRRRRHEVLIAYNRAPANALGILVAKLLGMRVVLDLEDADAAGRGGMRGPAIRLGNALVDRICDRALLACTALAAATRLRPVLPYYGVVEAVAAPRSWDGPVQAHLGGTLNHDTGAEWLADAIEQLRRDRPAWAAGLVITITGKGPSLTRLAGLAGDGYPGVNVHGRLTDADFAALRAATHVGLSLRPPGGILADTTFPSKTIEIASAGQVVLTTDVSDVRVVLGSDGAVFVGDGSVAALVEALCGIVEDPDKAAAIAARGAAAVRRVGDPHAAAGRVADFLFAGIA